MLISSGGGGPSVQTVQSVQSAQRTQSVTAAQGVSAQAPRLQNFSQPGPQLMHLSEGWTPQGQAYDPASQQVMSSYNKDGQVLLSVQGKDASCTEIKSVTLGATGPDAGICTKPPDKGGGIATDGEYLYVADTEGVYRYRMADIEAAQQQPFSTRPEVKAVGFQALPGGMNASYISVHDGKAYVGEFGVEAGGLGSDDYGDNSRLMRLDIGQDGALDTDMAKTKTIEAPDYAQGVAVTDKGLLYTTSYGSKQPDSWFERNFLGGNDETSPHALVFQPADLGQFEYTKASFHTVGELDYYAEELNIIDGEVWVTYESNAEKYKDKYEDNVGKAPENTSIQRIPLDALDLSGTGVTAKELEEAARQG